MSYQIDVSTIPQDNFLHVLHLLQDPEARAGPGHDAALCRHHLLPLQRPRLGRQHTGGREDTDMTEDPGFRVVLNVNPNSADVEPHLRWKSQKIKIRRRGCRFSIDF
jgi:hypothetical protein